MVTINTRVLKPQAHTINGVSAGGMMSARIECGYENILHSSPDGLQFQTTDRLTQYVRGSVVSQDWQELINLLTGAAGTSVFYERKSGVAEATGYIKHTLNNPVIHKAAMSLRHRSYGNVSYDFECLFADPTKTIADTWALLDAQAAPTYVAAIRSMEISACMLGSLNIYHVTGLDFNIAMQLYKASHDGDIGYTAVDAILSGMSAGGVLTFQDSTIATGRLTAQAIQLAAQASLVLTVKQAGGQASKTVTIANVVFGSAESGPSATGGYTEYRAPFMIANDPTGTTPLTLSGTNKILTLA